MATSYTSDKKIGALDPITGSLSANDEIVVNKNGDTLKASMTDVEKFAFSSKTQVSPQTGDVVVIRRGTDIRQVTTENLLPDQSVSNQQIANNAAIAHSKLATMPSASVMLGNASNVPTATAVTGDVTINNSGVTSISSGVIVNADISATAGIVDTKLDTIGTVGKVLNSATTAASANTANAIVSRDASGNFSAGTITANLTGTASGIADGSVTTAKIVDSNVTLSKLAAAVQEFLLPVGAVQAFARTSAPTGWLACNGQAVSRSTYASLFSEIGTTWGSGDGSTSFNVPDLRDRYLRHVGPTYSGAVGTTQLDEIKSHTHTASTNSTGAHTHTVSGTAAADGGHTHSASTGSAGSHDHNWRFKAGSSNSALTATSYLGQYDQLAGYLGRSSGTNIDNTSMILSSGSHTHSVTVNSVGDHTHTVSGTAASDGAHSHTVTVDNTGGTENRPHSATVLYCIKF